MPFLYDNDSASSLNLTGATGAQVFSYNATRDGLYGVCILLTNLASGVSNYTLRVEVTDYTGNSYGWYTQVTSKGTSDSRLRLEAERPFFVPSTYYLKARVVSSNSGDTSVNASYYIYDPSHGSDLGALGGDSLGAKVGPNFQLFFHNGNVQSSRLLDDLATPADVNAEVLDVLNVDTLIDGKTAVEALRIIAAVCAGKVSGAGTGSEVFRSLNDLANRVSVTVDAEGNRTAVTFP